MTRAKDITGEHFGKLVAKEVIGKYKRENVWLCRCDCGKAVSVKLTNLRTLNTKSCGTCRGKND